MSKAISAKCQVVPQPLYSQVRERMYSKISAGEWGAGEPLPNEFTLAAEFSVSIGTVRRAMEGLERTGVVKRMQGRGTFVSLFGSTAFDEKFGCMRFASVGDCKTVLALIGCAKRSCTRKEAGMLNLPETASVYDIAQLLSCGDRPAGIERSVIPVELLPRLETQMTFGQSIYRVLLEYGVLVAAADDTISAQQANAEHAEMLGVAPGAALLCVERVARTLDNRLVELRQGLYPTGSASYASHVSVSGVRSPHSG